MFATLQSSEWNTNVRTPLIPPRLSFSPAEVGLGAQQLRSVLWGSQDKLLYQLRISNTFSEIDTASVHQGAPVFPQPRVLHLCRKTKWSAVI